MDASRLISGFDTLIAKVNEFSEDYVDIKDAISDESVSEMFGDFSGALKLLGSSRRVFSKIKIMSFLKGFNHENAEKEDVERLIKYVTNQEKAEFVTSTFDRILFANSKYACATMGVMLSEITKTKRNVTQADLIIINALAVLNDFDIKNFTYLYRIMLDRKVQPIVRKSQPLYEIILEDIRNCAKKNNLSEEGIKLTINAMEKQGLLEKRPSEYDISYQMISVNQDESFYITGISRKLYEYSKVVFPQ